VVQVLGAAMRCIHFQFNRRATGAGRHFPCGAQQRCSQPLPAMFGNDVELIQPRHQTAVLERPGVRQRREAHRHAAVEGQEQGPSLRPLDQARDGSIEAVGGEGDLVLVELGLQKANRLRVLLRSDSLDVKHDLPSTTDDAIQFPDARFGRTVVSYVPRGTKSTHTSPKFADRRGNARLGRAQSVRVALNASM